MYVNLEIMLFTHYVRNFDDNIYCFRNKFNVCDAFSKVVNFEILILNLMFMFSSYKTDDIGPRIEATFVIYRWSFLES